MASDATKLPEGPFRGVPFVVKDLDGAVAGEPYTMSSRHLKHYVPDHDAEVITRMKRTGVAIVAKTNTPELGILGVTEPELRGATRNPWGPRKLPPVRLAAQLETAKPWTTRKPLICV